MKGVTVKQLRTFVSALLDKVDLLLKGEPARLIMYGAALVVFIVIQVLNARGITRLGANLSFDEALGVTAGSLALVVAVTESVRRFVYSPQTYIEDLSDEAHIAHEAAHLEEDLARQVEAAAQRREAELAAKQPTKRAVAVGTVKADGSGDKSN